MSSFSYSLGPQFIKQILGPRIKKLGWVFWVGGVGVFVGRCLFLFPFKKKQNLALSWNAGSDLITWSFLYPLNLTRTYFVLIVANFCPYDLVMHNTLHFYFKKMLILFFSLGTLSFNIIPVNAHFGIEITYETIKLGNTFNSP